MIVPPREVSVAEEGAWQDARVLIADDAVEAAETFGRLLEEALAQFKRAHSEQQAPFDIVFADIGMPRMDGYELAQCLRALPSGAKVPLVALTGFTRADDAHRAQVSGFDAHIGKPLSIGQLTATMQRLLGRREPDENG